MFFWRNKCKKKFKHVAVIHEFSSFHDASYVLPQIIWRSECVNEFARGLPLSDTGTRGDRDKQTDFRLTR